MNTDTPETDAVWNDCIAWCNSRNEREDPYHVALAELGDKLERERDQYRKALEDIAGWPSVLFDKQTPHTMRLTAERALAGMRVRPQQFKDMAEYLDALDGKSLCAGCQWKADKPGQWCDMFRDAPEELPCPQHDQFAPIRDLVAKSGMAKLAIAAAVIGMPNAATHAPGANEKPLK